MSAPACLYVGRTAHTRLRPYRRSFTYRIASLLIDIDRLEEASQLSRVFSINRFNLFSFHERDYGARDGSSLRGWAENAFARAGVALEGGRIRLLTFPRMFGYAFNPLSLWFGEGTDGRLRGVIYDVNNTFGDRHSYVALADGKDAERHEAEKVFYVSPFFPVRGWYTFRLTPPSDRFALSIRYAHDGEDRLTASQSGARREITTRSLLGLLGSQPMMTAKVIAGIHWEALHIWRRGAKFHDRPQPPAPLSVARRASQPDRCATV